ncbi:phosphotriesterase [Chloroflexota bacterium]
MRSELVGKVQTVLGLIDPDSLGMTLVHEHLCMSAELLFIEPAEPSEKKLAREPIRLDNLYWVRVNCFNNLDTLLAADEDVTIKEVMMYKSAGGRTIVEVTVPGFPRVPLTLARIAKATGVNIVMSTGYHMGNTHPPELAAKTEEEIAEGMVREITVGIENTGVRAGFIKIAASVPFSEAERKVLRTAAAVQRQTGASIGLHPSYGDDLVMENVNVLGDAGVDFSRTIIYHVDGRGLSQSTIRKILATGCYVGYDHFGLVDPFSPLGRIDDVPSDTQRVDDVIQLIGEGYLDQIIVADDVGFKHRLVTYGGYGYAHIPRDIVPLMRLKGISQKELDALLVENPKRLLPFVCPVNR